MINWISVNEAKPEVHTKNHSAGDFSWFESDPVLLWVYDGGEDGKGVAVIGKYVVSISNKGNHQAKFQADEYSGDWGWGYSHWAPIQRPEGV